MKEQDNPLANAEWRQRFEALRASMVAQGIAQWRYRGEFRESTRVLGLWRTLYLCFAYRRVMKVLHRFHLHYMPPKRIEGDVLLWCRWCGARHVERFRSGAIPRLDRR